MASGLPDTKRSHRKSAEDYFRDRARRRDIQRGFKRWRLWVEQIADRDHLFRCWKLLERRGGPAPGPDGFTYSDFSPEEVGLVVSELSREVIAGEYRPNPTRSLRIPKRPGSDATRELRIGNVCDRVVGKALDESFRRFWESKFSDRSFGYRPRRGTWDVLAALEADLAATDKRYLAVDDIRDAFGNVPIADVVEDHRRELERVHARNFGRRERERTISLINAVLCGHDHTRHKGIDQGGPYSPAALNVFLHFRHDLGIANMDCDLPWYRYADNLAYLCRDMAEAGTVLGGVGGLLHPHMRLKGEDGTRNLGDEGADLLGFRVRWRDGRLKLGIAPVAWDQLRQHLEAAHAAMDPAQVARSAVSGWVAAFAPGLESGEDLDRVLTLSRKCGHRESVPSERLKETWVKSTARWQRCRTRAKRRLRP